MILLYRILYELGKVPFQFGLYSIAIPMLMPAAKAGLAEAQMIVGFAYFNGRGVPASDPDAFQWLQKASDQGNAVAQRALGIMYVNGRGVARDKAHAADSAA